MTGGIIHVMSTPPKFDPALRDRLQELQIYLETAVDQLTRAQRQVMGSELDGHERADDPLLMPLGDVLMATTKLRNAVRDRLMKALSGSLKVIS
jgi:hypothetical protein